MDLVADLKTWGKIELEIGDSDQLLSIFKSTNGLSIRGKGEKAMLVLSNYFRQLTTQIWRL